MKGENVSTVLIFFGCISVIVYAVTSIGIYHFLAKRKEKIENFLLIRWYLFRYVGKYKKITNKETGKVGNLFYLWLISIGLALVCFVILVIQKNL